MSSLKEVFGEHTQHLKFDAKLADAFFKMQTHFVNKNQEHMDFFGGCLTGVQVVRFTRQELNLFFSDTLDLDPIELRQELLKLPDIHEERKVASDTFNLTCMYLVHRFLTSPLIDPKRRERAALDVCLLFNYKCLTSLMSEYFRYPADPRLAQATYANLSYRFLIKKLGSWQEVLNFRAGEMIDDAGLHRKNLIKFSEDERVTYAVTDSQGRLRSMLKYIYAEMMKAQKDGEKIYTTSSTIVDADGEEVFKDKVHGLENYLHYTLEIAHDKHSFIKQELIAIIVKMMPTMQERGFVKVLDWLTDSIGKPNHKHINDLIELTVTHSYHYLHSQGIQVRQSKDVGVILSKLKNIYVSSRTTDTDLLKMRELGAEMITDSIGKTNDQAVAAIRTGLFLYICLRTYTKHYYSTH